MKTRQALMVMKNEQEYSKRKSRKKEKLINCMVDKLES